MGYMMRNKNIRALFFDIGGVCLTNAWEYGSRQRAARHFSLDFKELDQRHHHVFGSFECGRITLDNYLTQVVFYKKRKFTEKAFFQFMKNESRPIPRTLSLLGSLQARGNYLLAAVNNESFELNDYRIKKFKLNRYFTNFFSSCFLGVRKPEPRIYQLAMKMTQMEAKEILFIDDRQVNAQAARALGMNVIHLEHVERLPEELKAYGIK